MFQFRFLNVPVSAHWTHLVLLVVFSGLLQATNPLQTQAALGVMVIISISILLHEYGHASAFRKFGGRPRIFLHGFGGLATAEGRFSRKDHLFIIAAGPGIQLVIAAIAWPIFVFFPPTQPLLNHWLAAVIWVNFFWAILNMLPIYPLDGGQFAETWFQGAFRKERGYAGAACAALVGLVLFQYTGSLISLIFFGYLAWQNWQYSQLASAPDFRNFFR